MARKNRKHLQNRVDPAYWSEANGVVFRLALCRRLVDESTIVTQDEYDAIDEANGDLGQFCLRCRDNKILSSCGALPRARRA